MNISNTKLMVGGKYSTIKTIGKWPCVVRGKDVGSISIRCTNCQWVEATLSMDWDADAAVTVRIRSGWLTTTTTTTTTTIKFI